MSHDPEEPSRLRSSSELPLDRPLVEKAFVESTAEEPIPAEILSRRICDFDLRIEGRPLEKLIERFRAELTARGITRLQPRFYLSDEWGVPEGTVAIGIPFYLADPELVRVQAQHGGLVEGDGAEDILRYLRHEMGHVVNYAYRLHATEEWTSLFGPMSRPYAETYRVVPFSTDFVRHLPGGYAQKHPDEDWAETFAVWMTPELDWRALYGDSPGALAKLEYCERAFPSINARDPEITDTQIDDEVGAIRTTLQEYYGATVLGAVSIPHSLDGDLQVIFARRAASAPTDTKRSGDAALLLRRQQDSLVRSVYRWTGVEPALLYQLVQHLAERARAMGISYALDERDPILVELSGFLTALGMNYAYTGKFIAS
ncbi:MAG: putative zinc-binding metallopeptidase [Planctomycetes bacterium]|nr:putative zinc-binding metallopeptidase [Planctomycetota bacterium]